MRRLCIFSIYDPEGQIDEYIYYWLKEFKTVCEKIIVVSNGKLKTGHRLSRYADQIIERENTGFDGGAYADVLTHHLSYERIQEFDEIVLCNDTCYGPFVPMRQIFGEMDAKENDFWGIQLWDEGYAHWLNSFFLVFQRSVIQNRNWYAYFETQIDQKANSMAEAYGNYEMGLYLWLTENGYQYDYYAVPSENHSMKCPDYFISKCRFPFLKKRSFCPEHYHEDNLRKAMTLIRSKGYELHLIIDNVSRKYELSDEIKAMAKSDEMDAQYLQYETGEYSVDKASKTPEQILAFIRKNNDKNMYVYGAGAFGSRVYLVYRKYMKNFKGFVVSKKTMDSVLGEKMYGIDEIPLDQSAIIIGMDKKNTETVLRENLAGAENVLNLYEQETDKKLSIITVVYNNVKEIEQTIQSVINQNLPPQNLEYIILDGGSTDGTCDIIKKYETSLSYWKSEPDNGIYDAMNKGIDIATGDIIAFLNSGDWYEANVLADILKFFSENETDIVYGKVNRIVNEEICGFMCNSTRDGDYERLHIKNLFCHQGMFMKKTLFQDYGKFDLQYKVLADYDWNLRVYNKGAKIKVIPEVVANYRTGGCSEKADTHEEYGKIAYRNLNGREDLLSEIDKNIKTSEEYYKLKKVLEESVTLSVPVINNNKHYYIWGLGGDAKLSFAILDKLDIKASGIIDRAAKVPEYNGIRVYPSCSAEIPKLLSDAESCVFISSTDYEDEIRKELDTLGIAEDKVISLREVWKYLIRLED